MEEQEPYIKLRCVFYIEPGWKTVNLNMIVVQISDPHIWNLTPGQLWHVQGFDT